MKSKGKITIGQYNNYRNDDNLSVHIQVEDEKSGTCFLEIHMTPVDFAHAILGNGFIDCVFELRAKNVGKTKERKTESIYLPHKIRTAEQRREILSVYETDGWVAYAPDLGNSHKATLYNENGSYYEVGFTRFVDTPEKVTE